MAFLKFSIIEESAGLQDAYTKVRARLKMVKDHIEMKEHHPSHEQHLRKLHDDIQAAHVAFYKAVGPSV